MTVRAVEWKKPYTWGTAIEIDENKVISLRLRDENNLIIYDAGDNEIYVDLQLPDELTPTDAFPVWITTGRVIVDNGWDLQWTLICAKTTSGDNIKLLYADEWTLWIDNWTWTFKQIYFKADVDGIITTLTTYINWELAKKQNWVTSDTAPSNPSEWDLWYDTTNDILKFYDGSQWSATWKTYTAGSHIDISNANVISTTWLQDKLNAGENITIWDVSITESDMKWPCPSGYHIPTSTEWGTLKSIWTTLWQSATAWDTFWAKFKLPFWNYRRQSKNATTYNQGVNGLYWSSTPNLNDTRKALFVSMRNWYLDTSASYYRGYGVSVRPFKNSAVAPDNTWTTILDWSSVAAWAWIFYNATLWLISASSNWTTWTTIADKNVWATVAWNEWDTLSADNCGWLFQRWNNYMFPFSGEVSTIETQVDTTGYWPWNYYSSDIFSIYYWDWSSPSNNNLRWWVTQGTRQNVTHNVISATDTTYTAGTWISISSNQIANTWVTSVNGSTWAVTVSEPTVVSGDSWTTYTVKVANSDPTSWTPATTITFVL